MAPLARANGSDTLHNGSILLDSDIAKVARRVGILRLLHDHFARGPRAAKVGAEEDATKQERGDVGPEAEEVLVHRRDGTAAAVRAAARVDAETKYRRTGSVCTERGVNAFSQLDEKIRYPFRMQPRRRDRARG